MNQLQDLFSGQKTVAQLLTEAEFDPGQIRAGRAFASQWAWSDGALTVATIWLHEIDSAGGYPTVRFRDPAGRSDLVGLRRSRAVHLFNVLSATAGSTVRVILQQRKNVDSGSPTQKRALDTARWQVGAESGAVVLRRLEQLPSSALTQSAKPWTDEELTAAVIAYLDIQSRVAQGVPINRKQLYRQLGAEFDRKPGAFERRMQNISYLLALKGRAWTPGLAPLPNVGARTAAKIEDILGTHEPTLAGHAAAFEVKVAEASGKLKNRPAGSLSPAVVQTVSLQFVRDPEVKAWVLKIANGVCECCGQPAPFNSVNGPFLEVHHVQRLADKGADTVENAIAICPNCHRRLHYAVDAAALVDLLYVRIERLSKHLQATPPDDDGILAAG